jgi:alpha-D-xyloside xylohydrolase
MVNAWADGTKPWSFPEVEAAVRDAIRLRARLLPYLYSAFWRYHADGTPPFRAMPLEGLDADVLDQYMTGDCLLVAPMFAGQTERRVRFPPGGWFDFWTGAPIQGSETTVSPGLERIPLFARDGGIVPMLRDDDPSALEIRHYGRGAGRFVLFEDDGETYAYEFGAHRLTELRVTAEGETVVTPLHQGLAPTYRRLEWRHMAEG